MARIDGKSAVCMVCSGSGAINLVIVIVDARLDFISLICIIG